MFLTYLSLNNNYDILISFLKKPTYVLHEASIKKFRKHNNSNSGKL